MKMHGRLAHGDEPLSYAQPQTFTLRGTDWPIRETLFLKAYFLVFKSTDVQSIQTRFRTELSRFFLDKGVDVRDYLCFSVKGHKHGHTSLKGFLIIYSHAQRFSNCILNESMDSVSRRGTDVKPTEAWFVLTRSHICAFITETQ